MNNWLSNSTSRKHKYGSLDPNTDPDLILWQKISTEAQLQSYKGITGKIQKWGHRIIERLTINKNGVTLEIGCGTGHHLNFMTDEQKKQYVGLDIKNSHLEKAKTHYNDLKFIQGDAYDLPFCDNCIDRVIALYIFEHLSRLDDCLREINRVIKNNGELLVAIPTEGGFAWHIGRQLTTKRYFEKRYPIDYEKVVFYEHCNSSWEIISRIEDLFKITKRIYMPFHIPSVHLNAIVILLAVKM